MDPTIAECKAHINAFFECLEKHKYMNECGPPFFYFTKCLEKLPKNN